jgi:hypothetical protein
VLLSSFPPDGAAACSARSGLARSTANINTAHRPPSRPSNRRVGITCPRGPPRGRSRAGPHLSGSYARSA